MADYTGVRNIAYCYFSAHMDGKDRQFLKARLWWFGLFPMLVGGLLTSLLPPPSGNNLGLVVAILSVVAAVLVGLLPIAHSILGQVRIDKKFSQGELLEAKNEINRVQTLQDLHAAVSWAVILLVVGLGACAFLALIPEEKNWTTQTMKTWFPRANGVLAGLLYYVMASTAMTFFSVARDVFDTLENQARTIKRTINQNTERPTSGKSPG